MPNGSFYLNFKRFRKYIQKVGESLEGWIKLHRKLIENPIFLKPDLLQLFIYCLLKANHNQSKIIFNGKEMIIERGQFVTGREALSAEIKQNGRSTYDRLKLLENLKILNIKSNNRFTLVTIVNYGLYQMSDEESNSESNNKPTTSQQLANTNKNVKNEKNEKKNTYGEKVKLTVEEYQKLITEYGEVGAKERIERLDLYIQSKGDKYKSHYATIRMWEKKNASEQPKLRERKIIL